MQTMRDFLGAWLVVGALGLAVVVVWGFGMPGAENGQIVACDDGVTHDSTADLRGAEVPHNGWRPLPELVGAPHHNGERLRSYDVAEERNLDALGAVNDPSVAVAQGSTTSLNPTSMC